MGRSVALIAQLHKVFSFVSDLIREGEQLIISLESF